MNETRTDLTGQVAVITGAGRGIGRVIALRLGRAGATVVLTGRDRRALGVTGIALDSIGAAWSAVRIDLTDPSTVDDLAKEVHSRHGVPDIVVCNSGIGGPSAPVWEIDPDGWEETFAVNTTGAFRTVRAFAPGMVERGSGSIVLIGSMTGKRPLKHRSPYAASKLGLLGFCRTAALDLAPHGVRINLVSPGFVAGERLEWVIEAQAKATGTDVETARKALLSGIPLGRFVSAEDVAHTVAFLASAEAAAITGEDINVTAGTVMH
ncbi:SDR family NAD(P)-dependent oxidoreductase [Amycolatopsis anabasis]|uniref:SDR family NAD(P)-dependent oxidoreductase n=1 Tax=Amycolatopsis anabasis TaxID=1840409 RepID=UPI00131ECF79|nr:SDR family oxidoreductase [Amycolatopsis anabasis]